MNNPALQRRFIVIVLLLFVTPFVILAAAPITRVAIAEPLGAETLSTLRSTTIPINDPVDLGRRLLGITSIPSLPPAKDYQVGDVVKFNAEDNDKNVTFTVSAQLWYKTPHVYMWFQTGFQPKIDAVAQAAETFESHIYPTVHKYFGSEASPGYDNDLHLYIIHVRGLGGSIAAYFDSSSEYPQIVVPSSNQHESFLVNLDAEGGAIGSDGYLGVLSHEFQHMVEQNVHENEDGWLNEGMSVLSELLNGYPDTSFQDSFVGQPQTQLDAWTPNVDATAPHYGASYLMMAYILQRFGDSALHAILTSPANGLGGIRAMLTALKATDPATNKPVTVEDLFADWTTTNLLDNPGVGDGRYAYTVLKTKPLLPTTTPLAVGQQTLPISQWGTTYLDVTQPGKYRFSLQCTPTVKVVPVDPHSGSKMWWSNRGDSIDTRLTHAFDLTGVNKATLSFWLWYGTEKDWDYGYVEVSTDGGATWKSISTQSSEAAGGHDNPYGPAYTGYIGGDVSNISWQHQTADLTPYAGKKIELRFELLNDSAVNLEGMLLDDISIPEIKYSTDAETGDDGWQAEGWVRVENVLPQRYVVQLIEYSSTPRVFSLLGPDDASNPNSGNWELDVTGGVSHLVVSISGLTEFTTQPGSCQVQLSEIQG